MRCYTFTDCTPLHWAKARPARFPSYIVPQAHPLDWRAFFITSRRGHWALCLLYWHPQPVGFDPVPLLTIKGGRSPLYTNIHLTVQQRFLALVKRSMKINDHWRQCFVSCQGPIISLIKFWSQSLVSVQWTYTFYKWPPLIKWEWWARVLHAAYFQLCFL